MESCDGRIWTKVLWRRKLLKLFWKIKKLAKAFEVKLCKSFWSKITKAFTVKARKVCNNKSSDSSKKLFKSLSSSTDLQNLPLRSTVTSKKNRRRIKTKVNCWSFKFLMREKNSSVILTYFLLQGKVSMTKNPKWNQKKKNKQETTTKRKSWSFESNFPARPLDLLIESLRRIRFVGCLESEKSFASINEYKEENKNEIKINFFSFLTFLMQ